MATQKMMILEYMQRGNGITDEEARTMFGCHRLAARVADLREMGYPVKTFRRTGKNRFGKKTNYAEYSL